MTTLGPLWGEFVAPAIGTALLAALASWGMCRVGGPAPTRLLGWASSLRGLGPEEDVLFAAMSDPAIVRDADGRVREANPAAREILGMGEPVDATCPRLAGALARGETTVTLSIEGAERVYDIDRSPVSGARRGAGTELVVLHDVTVRAGTEQELQRETERLATLASGVAHDLRTPLGLAKVQIGLAREESDDDHLAEAAWALDRMDDLVADLQAGAREDGQASDPESVHVGEIAEAAWRTVGGAEARLVTATDRTVRADPQRLQRLFENLFRNSIQHCGPDVTVTVGGLPTGLYVEDDGQGIPSEMRGDVFDAGYSTKAEGGGVGLHIVDRVAAAHGWNIHLDESADGGARFDIRDVDEPADTRSRSTA